jgi:hypothetical protein
MVLCSPNYPTVVIVKQNVNPTGYSRLFNMSLTYAEIV